MDIYTLTAFIKTAELLHFGKASRACNMSASALSRLIQRLEEQLDQQLFLRDNRSVILTKAGVALLDYSRRAVQNWSEFTESLNSNNEISGHISVYASITAVYSLLPELIESYRREHPAVQLDLSTGAAEQGIEKLLSGEIDIAVVAEPDKVHTSLEFLPLIKTPLVFIAPKQPYAFEINHNSQLNFSKLPLVLPLSGAARTRLDGWLNKNAIKPLISTEVSGNEGLIAMVRLGSGVGVVPKLALERSPFRDNVQIIKNAPKLKPFVVGLCTTKRNHKRPAVRALFTIAKSP
ncbi:MAG: HTH-type transcriptional activator IlvY [Kiritimatiellae bacterium]|jgi:LysR family positive regulator for ilvC|nr:HTH-type transcriptional activator IlvY [Kiritimatiellia bacterium]